MSNLASVVWFRKVKHSAYSLPNYIGVAEVHVTLRTFIAGGLSQKVIWITMQAVVAKITFARLEFVELRTVDTVDWKWVRL